MLLPGPASVSLELEGKQAGSRHTSRQGSVSGQPRGLALLDKLALAEL